MILKHVCCMIFSQKMSDDRLELRCKKTATIYEFTAVVWHDTSSSQPCNYFVTAQPAQIAAIYTSSISEGLLLASNDSCAKVKTQSLYLRPLILLFSLDLRTMVRHSSVNKFFYFKSVHIISADWYI